MNTNVVIAALVALWAGISQIGARPDGPASLLVLSKADRTLSVVDPKTLAVLGTAPSGPDPHEVVASSDGRTAYIANYNGGGNIITPVDLLAMKTLPPIDLGPLRAPHGLAFAGGKLWFTAEAAKAIGSYDPATRKVERVLETGQNGTHMVFVSNDLQRLVTTNMGSGTLSIVEKPKGGGDWTQTLVTVGPRGEGFDVSPNGKEAWVANAGDGTVSIVDLGAKKLIDTLAVQVNGANRLKFTPDGKHVLISTLTGANLTVIDAATRRVVKRVNVGHGSAGVEIQPDGARAYVACTPDNYVAVIDLKSLDIVGRINAGGNPDGLAWVSRP